MTKQWQINLLESLVGFISFRIAGFSSFVCLPLCTMVHWARNSTRRHKHSTIHNRTTMSFHLFPHFTLVVMATKRMHSTLQSNILPTWNRRRSRCSYCCCWRCCDFISSVNCMPFALHLCLCVCVCGPCVDRRLRKRQISNSQSQTIVIPVHTRTHIQKHYSAHKS